MKSDSVDLDFNGAARYSDYSLSGGNRNLVPEVAKAWTGGVSFSPSFLTGFNLSVDYYDIQIDNAISTPNAADITAACASGDAGACGRVVRDGTGTITQVSAVAQNIAGFKTSGYDIEASYRVPLTSLPGALRFRALATYVNEQIFDSGANVRDTAGDVGDTVTTGLPKWRANFSIAYDLDPVSVDARLRYVGGGKFNDELNIVNGDISARPYVDLGAEFTPSKGLTGGAAMAPPPQSRRSGVVRRA